MYLFQKLPSCENTGCPLLLTRNFWIEVDSKTCEFLFLCWSPSQTNDDIEKFTDNLEITADILAESNSYFWNYETSIQNLKSGA